MLVTSDSYDLAFMARTWMDPFIWSENLIGGISFYGSSWPGGLESLAFLEGAAEICNVSSIDIYGYSVVGESRTRNVKRAGLEKALKKNSDLNKYNVKSVLVYGTQSACGTPNGTIEVGGEISLSCGTQNDFEAVRGHFLFPWRPDGAQFAAELLKRAANHLGAQYGFFFIRDEFAFPGGYASGFCPAFSSYDPDNDDCKGIMAWNKFQNKWINSNENLKMRDIYNINLISDNLRMSIMGNSMALVNWIQQITGGGQLIELSHGMYLWTLCDEEIRFVRNIAKDYNIYVAEGRQYYRDI